MISGSSSLGPTSLWLFEDMASLLTEAGDSLKNGEFERAAAFLRDFAREYHLALRLGNLKAASSSREGEVQMGPLAAENAAATTTVLADLGGEER